MAKSVAGSIGLVTFTRRLCGGRCDVAATWYDVMLHCVQLIDRLDVRLYRLSCNMDISAAELSYGAMKD